ncbi:hypothetical protein EYC80_004803 [Monilinia laxa]|uniref:Uncharacterized protein n=1 Tax=Monilinia laxa TaxID=61186 RepID=A0A5N6KHX2_MONLA|nr:hypothetical protein EYC80_004803 [Monilinia laxa]
MLSLAFRNKQDSKHASKQAYKSINKTCNTNHTPEVYSTPVRDTTIPCLGRIALIDSHSIQTCSLLIMLREAPQPRTRTTTPLVLPILPCRKVR